MVPSPRGILLFNHLTAVNPERARALWTEATGWYAAETGLDNSLLLQPLGPPPRSPVSHARWDCGLAILARRQFAKPSFRTFILEGLRRGGVVAAPALFRVA